MVMVLLGIWILAVILQVMEGRSIYRNGSSFILLKEQVNYGDAMSACDDLGLKLPYYNDSDALLSYMQHNQIRSVWLGIRKTVLPDWQWMDGSNFSRTNWKDENQEYKECGVVSVSSGIEAKPCRSPGVGFLCQMPAGKSCPLQYHTHSCWRSNGNINIIVCNSKNWYNARSYCVDKGGELAIVDSEYKVQATQDYITDHRLTRGCSVLFIGLRSSAWHYTDPVLENETISSGMYDWATEEPGPGECVKFVADSHQRGWATDKCINKNTVICQAYDVTLYSDERVATNTITSVFLRDPSKAVEIVTIVSIVAIILAVVVAVMIVVLSVRRIRQNIIRAKPRQTIKKLDEGIPLLPKTSKTLQNFKGISLALFTDGIDKTKGELKDVLLKNIRLGQWPEGEGGTAIAVNVAKGFNDTLNCLKLEKSPSLCVINLNAFPIDPRGKLPIHTQRIFENACLDDTYPVDIAILPGGRIPFKEELLKSLWQTRKKFVCVTAAKQKENEAVCPEVIAIGVSKFSDDMIKSGVLDFCIPMEEHVDLEEGVGTVAGIIAGIICKMKQSNFRKVWEENENKTRTMRNLLLSLVSEVDKQEPCCGFGELNIDMLSKIEISEQRLKSASKLGHVCLKVEPQEETSEVLQHSISDKLLNSDKTNCIKILVTTNTSNKKKQNNTYEKIAEARNKTGPLGRAADVLDTFFTSGDRTVGQLIELSELAVYMDWLRWREEMNKYTMDIEEETKPDIIIIKATDRVMPQGMKIQHIIRSLKKNFILITNATCVRGPVSPLAFPADSVIAVGLSGNKVHGSTLDFVMPNLTKEEETETVNIQSDTVTSTSTINEHEDTQDTANLLTHTDEDGKSVHTNTAAKVGSSMNACLQAAEIAALVLLRAQQLDIEPQIQKKLRNTRVMRNILVEMCSHPDEHKCEEGFGELQPWQILDDDTKMRILINHYTKEGNITDYWDGKTI